MVYEFKKKYTVKVHRTHLSMLRDGLSLEEMKDGSNLEKLQTNIQKAGDYLLEELFGIAPEEVENLTQSEYEELMLQIEELKDPKVQKD